MTNPDRSGQTSHPLIRFSVEHPRRVIRLTTLITLVLALLAALSSIWPQPFRSLAYLEVDTDPENMLPQDEAVRVFYNRMKRAFYLHDRVVVGVVNEVHPSGVFNPPTLSNVHALAEVAKTLRWPDEAAPGGTGGVIEEHILARALVAERGSWKAAAGSAFGAPAWAITRNGLVISLGFLPLLLAP